MRCLHKHRLHKHHARSPRFKIGRAWLGRLLATWIAIAPFSECLAFDWPLARGDREGTGVSTEKLPSDLEVLWEFKTGNAEAGFEATPVISNGKVLIGDFEGNVYAIDLENGQPVWTRKADDGIIVSGGCSDGKLVLGDFNSKVYCYRIDDGELLWSKEMEQPIVSGANFFGESTLVSSDSGSLHALSLATGDETWVYETGDQLKSTASIWKETALLGGCDSKLHRINVQVGDAVAEGTPLMAPTLSTPNIIQDVAIVPTQPGTVLAIKAETGEVLWSYKPDGGANADIRGSAAVMAEIKDGQLDGIVVVPSRNRRLLGLNAADGALKWETVLKKRSDGSPVICDGRAWIGASDGMLYAINLQDGKEAWTYQLSGQILGSPAISNGRLVVATEKGAVVCFGKKKD